MEKIPNIGQLWPQQGGINMGLVRGEDGQPDYYLIGAEHDVEGEHEWGNYGKESAAKSRWDGLKNTLELLKDGGHPAAEIAAAYTADGHNDFYLASRQEHAQMYASCPEQFDTSTWYWTSTQYSALNAWFQDFGGGYQYFLHKDYAYAVRPVRRYYPLSNSTI